MADTGAGVRVCLAAGVTDTPGRAVPLRARPQACPELVEGAERPTKHLAGFRGDLHADGYAGFDRLYSLPRTGSGGERIAEVACWAHVRRKFYDVHVATASASATATATAREALDHIAGLYAVEQDVRGRPPDERRRERQAGAGPRLTALRQWIDPQAWLADTIARIADHPARRVAELLPWNYRPA